MADYKELRRSGVFVSLDGHGADELLGMYAQGDFISFYDSPHLLTNWSENKRRINEYNTFLNSLENPQLFKSPAEAIFAYHPDFAFAGKIKNTFLNSGAKLKRKLSGNRFSIFRNNPVLSDDDFSQVGANDELPKEWGFINRLLYKQFHSDVLPTILRNFDRVSMAHGVEVRMPFMDWRLVSYAFSLPDSSKLSMGMTKRIAREAMKNRIPESIRTSRLKVGFNSPLPEWLNGPLKNWVKEIIYSPELQSHDLINIKAFQKFAEIHFRNNNWSWGNSEFAWQIVQFLWFEKQLSRKSI
jgi:asparagine synthase (glutamine-hydrolysing)